MPFYFNSNTDTILTPVLFIQYEGEVVHSTIVFRNIGVVPITWIDVIPYFYPPAFLGVHSRYIGGTKGEDQRPFDRSNPFQLDDRYDLSTSLPLQQNHLMTVHFILQAPYLERADPNQYFFRLFSVRV